MKIKQKRRAVQNSLEVVILEASRQLKEAEEKVVKLRSSLEFFKNKKKVLESP